jgi:hypothetical protein
MSILQATPEAMAAARTLWIAAGMPSSFLPRLKLSGHPNSAINSSFKLGHIAQVPYLNLLL